jgi:hypothetical protein
MPEKTYDLSSVLCTFVVDLDETTSAILGEILDPIRAIRSNASNAKADILAMRPLLVIVSSGLAASDHLALQEAASACGAEMVILNPADVRREDQALSVRLFELIRTVEKRRLAR